VVELIRFRMLNDPVLASSFCVMLSASPVAASLSGFFDAPDVFVEIVLVMIFLSVNVNHLVFQGSAGFRANRHFGLPSQEFSHAILLEVGDIQSL
jgi:hypothetical protein